MTNRGRPRKLRPELETDNQQDVDIQNDEKDTSPVENEKDPYPDIVPYDPKEGLPKAKYEIKKGKKVLLSPGEPRYYFNSNGQELIRVYQGISKKTQLASFLKINSTNQTIADEARQMRNALLKKGIPIKGRDFQIVRSNG